MSKPLKTNIIKCLIAFLIGLAIAVYYVMSRNFMELEMVERYRTLCDGFFLPGVFMIFIGLLFTMNNLGALDSISYLMKYAVRAFVPGAFAQMEPYLDYVQGRREKRIKGFGFLYVVGLIFLAVSVVFLVLFYSVYSK